MSILPFTALACPLDGAPLHREGGAWKCASGHNFDIASQGHTHLLPVQHKRSLDPGDSKEMVAARRRFLNAGHYQPIAEAVARAVLADLPAQAACLDAGCGEGYYLRQLAAAATGQNQTLAILGLDISKWAVLAGAKQDSRPNWVVGTNARLPVLDATLDRVLCLFGFPGLCRIRPRPQTGRPADPGRRRPGPPARTARNHLPDAEAAAHRRRAGAGGLHLSARRHRRLYPGPGRGRTNRRPPRHDPAPLPRQRRGPGQGSCADPHLIDH